jgi:hypothetical protein
VSDDGISKWVNMRELDEDNERANLFRDPKVQEFLEWLQEDDEESEESSDDESL